jgi:hypothetical protein
MSADQTADTDHRLFHTEQQRYGTWVGLLAAAGFITWAVLTAHPGARWIMLPAAAVMLLGAWRGWVSGIGVDDDGLRVVQVLSTKRVAWSDIDHCELRRLGENPFVAYLVLTDGQALPTVGLSSVGAGRGITPLAETKRDVQDKVDALNQIINKHTGRGIWPAAPLGS